MSALQYEEFEIELEHESDGRYRVRVLRAPAQEARGLFINPLPPDAMDEPPATREDARALGQQLFKALFRDQVLTCWRQSEAIVRERDHGLRLRLRLPPELAALPWELLFDPETQRFLAHSSQMPIVRQPIAVGTSPPLEVSDILRVLVVLASPSGLPDLGIDEERARIHRALREGPAAWRITADFVQGPDTLNQMRRRLRQREYHIVHIVAHGARRVSDGTPSIVLEDETGGPDPVDGPGLVELLVDFRSVRLVVLSACESAEIIPGSAASALVQDLLRGGILAVIGMQWALKDIAGTRFAHELYAAIADGSPADAAISDARERLAHELPDTLDWAAPVLYLRGRETALFSLPERHLSWRAPALRRPAIGSIVGLGLATAIIASTRWLDPLGVLVSNVNLIALGMAIVLAGASIPWIWRPPSRAIRIGAAIVLALALVVTGLLGTRHAQVLLHPRTLAIAAFDGSKASYQANIQPDIYNVLLEAGFQPDELILVDVVAIRDQALRRARQYRTAGILWGYYDDTKVVPYATIVGWSQNVQPQIRRVVAVDGPGTTKLATYIGKPLQEDMKGLGLLVRGMVQEYQGDHEGALESLDQAERLLTQTGHETSLRPVYTLRGRAYFLLGQLPQAKDAYTRAIEAPGEEKDPLLAFAYNGRGAIRFLQGDAEGALADLNKALAIMPDHIQARFNRALVYLSTGDAASALPDAQRTVELAPGFQRAQLLLAACYIDLDRSDEAASLLKAYLKRYPDDANAHYLHGVALTMQGELTAAMDEITTALEAAPDYVDALYQRAAILEKQGNLQEAHETYEQVVALCRSDSATVPYLRIQCDRHLAAAEEAIERLRSR